MTATAFSWLDEPIFAFTSDADWASEYCIAELLQMTRAYGIIPTIFSTHKSEVLDGSFGRGEIELGVHPNFLPGSSHGDDIHSVIAHVFDLVPDAVCFRSHGFVDSSEISSAMAARNMQFDSNLCLYLQPNLVPLHHWSGIIRFPVFWEDDIHWHRGGSWQFDELKHVFVTPGLKVLNVHPLNFALNIPDGSYYARLKRHTTSLTEEEANTIGNARDGVRTFVIQLIEHIYGAGYGFLSLGEIYARYKNEITDGQ